MTKKLDTKYALEPFPHAEKVWLWTTVFNAIIMALMIRSSVLHALPGVNAALPKNEQILPFRVAMDWLSMGKTRSIEARSMSLSGTRSLHTMSTLSPVFSDLQLDPMHYMGKGHAYRTLTYAMAHRSLPHLAFDALTARRAVVRKEPLPFGYNQVDSNQYGSTSPEVRKFLDKGEAKAYAIGNLGSLSFLYLYGTFVGALWHLSYLSMQKATGGAAGIAALQGARFATRWRIGAKVVGSTVSDLVYRDFLFLAIGNYFLGIPPIFCIGGFAAGALYGYLSGPRFSDRVNEEPSEYLRKGDARDARFNRLGRNLAPRRGRGSSTLIRQDAIISTIIFAILFCLITEFPKAILQTPIALRRIFFVSPAGKLSDRLLTVPPRVTMF